jgi:excinuclease UvrABC nuclease subunit
VVDLLYVDPDQVREFITSMAKEGLVAGVYLWLNRVNGKMYVGSSMNLYSRISGYLRPPFFQVGNYVALEKSP